MTSSASAPARRGARFVQRWWAPLAASAISTSVALWVLRPWINGWNRPWSYTSDTLSVDALIKASRDHGWFYSNHSLAAPFHQHFIDFPMPDTLHFLLMKLMSFVLPGPWAVANVYYLLTFPAVTLTTYWLARHLKISKPVAALVGVLFSCSQYHFERNILHIALSAYYTVPLGVFLLLRLAHNEPLFMRSTRFRPRGIAWVVSGRSLQSLGFAIVLAWGSTYYAVFFAIFAGMIGLAATWRRWSLRPVLSAVLIGALMVITVLVNLAPTTLYHHKVGANPTNPSQRSLVESSLYAFNLTELVIPADHHRIHALADIRNTYEKAIPPTTESPMVPLGALGALGVLALLGIGIVSIGGKSERVEFDDRLRSLAELNIVAFLVGTTGGIGLLVALLVSPQLRGWNRISVVLGLLGLLCIGIGLDKLAARVTKRPTVALAAGVLVVGLLGLYDQITPNLHPQWAIARTDFVSDDALVKNMERRLPHNAAILELPAVDFPERPPIYFDQGYDELRLYLHSTSLRWSVGGIKGRVESTWQSRLAINDPELLAKQAVATGFQGVVIDTYAYPSSPPPYKAELDKVLGPPTLVSADSRWLFYDLRAYAKSYRAETPTSSITALEQQLLGTTHPS